MYMVIDQSEHSDSQTFGACVCGQCNIENEGGQYNDNRDAFHEVDLTND